jgi:hypothetical protein
MEWQPVEDVEMDVPDGLPATACGTLDEDSVLRVRVLLGGPAAVTPPAAASAPVAMPVIHVYGASIRNSGSSRVVVPLSQQTTAPTVKISSKDGETPKHRTLQGTLVPVDAKYVCRLCVAASVRVTDWLS